MHIDLDRLSESELVDLNARVVERLRLLRQARAQMAMFQFNVGDRVGFESESGAVICGTLVRHNKTSVTVRTDAGAQWRVSPGLLRPAAEVSVQPATSATIIPLPRKP